MVDKIIKIPSAISKREINLLMKLARNKNVLEIGSLLGYSTINMAKVSRKVTSIDPHRDYPFKSATPTLNKFRNNLHRYNIKNVNMIVDTFQNVNIGQYDMVFIDLDGTYKTTIEALKSVKHIPLIVVHDFNRSNCKGIKKAVEEFNKPMRAIDTCIVIYNY